MHINAKNTLRDMKRFVRRRKHNGKTTPQLVNAQFINDAKDWADTVFESGWRIPLIVRVPQIKATKGWSMLRMQFNPPPTQPVGVPVAASA